MTKHKPEYSPGDKLVHRNYGIGQIDSIEIKPMQGVEVECYKVKTDYGFYWFRLSDIDNPRIHPLASQELIKKLVEILCSVPQGLNNDPHQCGAHSRERQHRYRFPSV